MLKPKTPKTESDRLKNLNSYFVLDSLPEEEYDAITRIASNICNTPIALVTFVDENRQWFKSKHGINATETHRDLSLCAHAIHTPNELFIVPDTSKDARFLDNPLVTNAPHVAFYAGAPLNSPQGHALGTLCVVDKQPRANGLTEEQQDALKGLAKQIIALLELRRINFELKHVNKELKLNNEQLNHFTYRLSHDFKSPIRNISTLANFIADNNSKTFKDPEIEEWSSLIHSRVEYMDSLINDVITYLNISSNLEKFETFNIENTISAILEKHHNNDALNLVYQNCNTDINHSIGAFHQIFSNLLSNSYNYKLKTKATVWITFKESNEFYTFSFEDDGPGIPHKYWSKVFLMFEKLKDSNANNKGIGLATIKSIILKLGGNIKLKKRKHNKEGVCFYFTLPKESIHTPTSNVK